MEAALEARVATRQPLLRLLQDLQQALEAGFDGARSRYGVGLWYQQLGIELLCKLEEQLLHPALQRSRARFWPALAEAMGDIARLRALSSRIDAADAVKRPFLVAALDGLTRLHFDALRELLRDAAGSAEVDWDALEREARAMLARWRDEIREHGAIEDEDGDPVGHPPR